LSLQVRKTNVNKQRLFLALRKDFFAVSAALPAAKSLLLHWTDNFTILLTLALAV